MNLKYLLTMAAVASFFSACGDEVTKVYENEGNGEAVIDTIYSIDTLVLNNIDTVRSMDTLVLNNVDTIHSVDTIVVNLLDSMIIKDTLVVLDTVLGLNGASCNAEPIEGGYKIICGEEAVGVVMNGESIKGDEGKSAYEIAVENGFEGTEEQWLASLKGEKGDDGMSAYDVAVKNGYSGTESQWLASLKGANGESCSATAVSGGYSLKCGNQVVGTIKNGENCTATSTTTGAKITCGSSVTTVKNGEGCKVTTSAGISRITCADGSSASINSCTLAQTTNGYTIQCGSSIVGNITNGTNGLSAYEIAVKNGFSGTETEWLESLEAKPTYGQLVDSRDGSVYKTVRIGTQHWMAENLNWQMVGSYCYGEVTNRCATYGRLYSYSDAAKACPNGWRLPTISDISDLAYFVGGTGVIGYKLKSVAGWNNEGNGIDFYGFSALPAGRRFATDGSYDGLGVAALFWAQDEQGWGFTGIADGIVADTYPASDGLSVRCIEAE